MLYTKNNVAAKSMDSGSKVTEFKYYFLLFTKLPDLRQDYLTSPCLRFFIYKMLITII